MEKKLLIAISKPKDLLLPADGYILGYEKFTCFASYNVNFEELKAISKDKNIFLSLNAIIHEDNLQDFKEEIDKLIELPISFIVQDVGALAYICSLIDKDRVIFEPYTLICNQNDLITYNNYFGVSVSISNNLSIDEKINLSKNVNSFIEIFGRYPIYQSYRQVISLYENYKKYKIDDKNNLSIREDTRTSLFPIIENQYGSFIFSEEIVDLSKMLDSINSKFLFIDSLFVDHQLFVDKVKEINILLGAKDE